MASKKNENKDKTQGENKTQGEEVSNRNGVKVYAADGKAANLPIGDARNLHLLVDRAASVLARGRSANAVGGWLTVAAMVMATDAQAELDIAGLGLTKSMVSRLGTVASTITRDIADGSAMPEFTTMVGWDSTGDEREAAIRSIVEAFGAPTSYYDQVCRDKTPKSVDWSAKVQGVVERALKAGMTVKQVESAVRRALPKKG